MPRQGKICKFLGCSSRSKIHPDKKFYPFAKPWIDREKCLRWIAATGRKDFPVEYVNKECYVCGDHFPKGGPSEENPDPFPNQKDCGDDPPEVRKICVNQVPEEGFGNPSHREIFVESLSNSQREKCFIVKPVHLEYGSPQVASAIKKRKLPPKKVDKKTEDTILASTSGDCYITPEPASEHSSSSRASSEHISTLSAGFFDHFMADIQGNGTNENKGISHRIEDPSQDTSTDKMELSHDVKKDRKRSFRSQTLNRWKSNTLSADADWLPPETSSDCKDNEETEEKIYEYLKQFLLKVP